MLSKTTASHLPKVPHVKQIEGIKQLAVPQAELIMAHFQECPDVLQTQKLEKRETNKERQIVLLRLRFRPDCKKRNKHKWKCIYANCKPMEIFPYLTALKHCHFTGMENCDTISFLQRVEHI